MRRDRGPLITFAAAVVIAFVSFAVYALHRQQISDGRYERQRDAICKVLASLPGQHPFPSIDRLRVVEARPGHPHDCQPIPHPTSAPSSTPTPGRAAPTVVLIPAPAARPAAASPTATSTASPRSTQTPSPTPRPSPSPTCGLQGVIHHPVHCLHL